MERRAACLAPYACALGRPNSWPSFPGHEICPRGGACQQAKRVCVADPAMPSGGNCVSGVGAVTCGAHGECTPERPWCSWNGATEAAECIARGPWDERDGVYQCDGPEDCAGVPCCVFGDGSRCSAECGPGIGFAPAMCHRDTECPGVSAEFVTRCVAYAKGGLPGARVCTKILASER